MYENSERKKWAIQASDWSITEEKIILKRSLSKYTSMINHFSKVCIMKIVLRMGTMTGVLRTSNSGEMQMLAKYTISCSNRTYKISTLYWSINDDNQLMF